MKIYVVNYADINFNEQQKLNSETALSYGCADKVFSFSPNDIDKNFLERNKKILLQPRGAGLWLWKPYFIKKVLDSMEDGDYLFYCDSAAYFTNKISYLIDSLENSNQSIMGFALPLLERQFSKKESFKLMNYNCYDNNQILATCIFIKKNAFTTNFVGEWLSYSSNEKIISGKHFCKEVDEFVDFRVHREDQSVFSILYHKYGLKAFRDPSQFGLRPWEYKWKPYIKWSLPWKYRQPLIERSSYPELIKLYRAENLEQFRKRESLKSFLYRIGFYSEKSDNFFGLLKNKFLNK